MGKGKKASGPHRQQRTRLNPLTGEIDKIDGTKAGRGRMREAFGSPLRTHDGPLFRRSKRSKTED